MPERSGTLLLDTDMLVLLTAAGLLESVANHLGYTHDQIRRLPAAVHQVKKSKRFRDTYGEEVLQHIFAPISAIKEIEPPTDLELLEALNASMDPGEAQLVAIAATEDCTLLASGDKRAICDLTRSGATDCITAMGSRIVSLEAILWILVAECDPHQIRAAFMPVLGHSTLRIVLSEHAVADQTRCRDGIRTYFNDLDAHARGMLYNPAFDQLGGAMSGDKAR
jgi:hypothetical protein